MVPCPDARVFLMVRPLDMESIKKKAAANGNGQFNPRLAHLYVDFVVSKPEAQRAAYAKARTDSRGHFEFKSIPGDRWYYVVAQALGDVMVSWQVSVFLYMKERVQVVLTNTNAALPIYSEGPASPPR